MNRCGTLAALLALTLPTHAAQTPTASEKSQPTASVQVSRVEIPFSTLASVEARDTLARLMTAAPGPDFQNDIEAARRFYGKFNDERLAEMRERYSVKTSRETMAGVTVDVVVPAEPVPGRNRGMWHAYFVFPRLPESQETYGVIGRFFDERLGVKVATGP